MKDIWRMEEMNLTQRLKQFLDDEARSCSMDFGCVTPEYVYRMWGGSVPLEDIATALEEIRTKQRLLRK